MTTLNKLFAFSKPEMGEECPEVKSIKMYFSEAPFKAKSVVVRLVTNGENPNFKNVLFCCDNFSPITWNFTVYYKSVIGGRDVPSDMYALSYSEALKKRNEAQTNPRYIMSSAIVPKILNSKGNGELQEVLEIMSVSGWLPQ